MRASTHGQGRVAGAPRHGVVGLVAAAALAVSACSGTPVEGGSEPQRAASASASSPRQSAPAPPSTQPSAQPTSWVDAPATRRPRVLASQLERAVTSLRGEDAGVQQRRAGELLQLGLRALASKSAGFRRSVIGELPPEPARITRDGVVAARELDALNTAERRLPEWRIVAPPPATTLLRHYRAAQRRTGVPWTYLAAIHLVETRMGRIRGTSTAGAKGPMQFLPPTWELYGGGGDINDPADAILAAARLLEANGAPADMAGALWHYNPSDRYVRAVSAYADTMQRTPWVYEGYWHWRVLYRHVRGTYLLPVGYPRQRPVLLDRR